MQIFRGRAAAQRVATLAARGNCVSGKERAVRQIVGDVRRRGDAALLAYARRWDGLATKSLRVSAAEMRRAASSARPELLTAVNIAAVNIRRFAERQKSREWMHSNDGVCVGQLVRPLDSVGCYVPGGRYPLISTLQMTAIPAQVAGVARICVVSPNPQPALLAVAHQLGIKEFYRVGGAQAIAALAYGTKSIPRVAKIVGPGNMYVTQAKKLVAFDCAIDMLAGPTETVIVSHNGNANYIASDLVAQAEHDPDTLAILITCSQELAKFTVEAVEKLPQRNAVAKQSLKKHGHVLVASSPQQAMDWANAIAPEHVTVSERDLRGVRNAGSVFVGDYSAQAAGDYLSGPNHVLPTGGAARFRGGLTVFDFLKVMTVQQLSREGLCRLAPAITELATAEGLEAHADSIRARFANA